MTELWEAAFTQNQMEIPIHHGSVTDMPFDTRQYDGVFSDGLLHLLDPPARAKLLDDCHRQLREGPGVSAGELAGSAMIFTVISKQAPMFGRGTKLGDDWYEVHPGVKMFFYDAASIQRELGPHGELELSEIDEATPGGGTFPFLNVVCRTRAR